MVPAGLFFAGELLDVDGNGVAEAETDGQLILRFLSGGTLN